MSVRSLTELIDQPDPAWPLLQQWLAGATNTAVALAVTQRQAADVLLRLQITTRLMMGAVAFETGGIWIDNGWLRFLGSGASLMPSTLLSFNGLSDQEIPCINRAFVVAYDIVGGFFAINGGVFPGQLKNIFYLAPDTLGWEDLERSYTDLLYWALYGDLALFYRNARWDGWQADMASIDVIKLLRFIHPYGQQGHRSHNAVAVLYRFTNSGNGIFQELRPLRDSFV